MESPHTLRSLWEHLFNKKTKKEIGHFGLILILIIWVVATQPYQEASTEVNWTYFNLSRRLGYAILIKAGYGEATPLDNASEGEEASEETQKVESGQWIFNASIDDHSDFYCLGAPPDLDLSSGDTLDTRLLIVSMVAAEKYNRSSIQRKLELGLAEISLKLFGKLPNFSYGLSQIRPDKIFSYLRGEPNSIDFDLQGFDLSSQKKVFEALKNDCLNVKIASKYIEHLSRLNLGVDGINVDQLIENVSLQYNGSSSDSINGLRYADAVKGAYYLLKESILQQAISENTPNRPDLSGIILTGCLFFLPGEDTPISDIQWLFSSRGNIFQERGHNFSAQVFFPNSDLATEPYADTLSANRKGWVFTRLLKLGFSEGRIIFTDYEDMARVNYFQAGNSCPEGSVMISISE